MADCSATAPVEVWRTEPVRATSTWDKPPAELELLQQTSLGHGAVACPGAFLRTDVLAQVNAAIARHEKTISFEVRLGGAAESDPGASRTMRPFWLALWSNTLPKVGQPVLLNPDRSGDNTLYVQRASPTALCPR